MNASLNAALNRLGVDPKTTDRVATARKAYLHLAKSAHPDHGGDPVTFLSLKEAWDIVQQTSSSTSSVAADVQSTPVAVPADVAQRVAEAFKCFDQLLRADLAGVAGVIDTKPLPPAFCIEPAVRPTKCQIDPLTPIPPGALRFGVYHPATHSYTKWSALKPGLEVPSRVHLRIAALGVAEPSAAQVAKVLWASKDLVRGVGTLSDSEMDLLATLCLDKTRWAAEPSTKPKKRKALVEAPRVDDDDEMVKSVVKKDLIVNVEKSESPAAPAASTTGTDLLGTAHFDPKVLAAQKFVLSGVFDFAEATGGLQKGKGELESLIAQHGGKTASAVSGKTTALLVGRLPGGSKVVAAKRNEVPILDVGGLFALLRGADLKDVPRASLDSVQMSKGFGGNGIGVNRLTGPAPVPALAAS